MSVGEYVGDVFVSSLSEAVHEHAVVLDTSPRQNVQQSTVPLNRRLARLHVALLSARDAPYNSWRFSAVVASFVARTKLLNVEPG